MTAQPALHSGDVGVHSHQRAALGSQAIALDLHEAATVLDKGLGISDVLPNLFESLSHARRHAGVVVIHLI